MVSPPSLMDDVDAVQAQIARNMLTSGDWVTARLDGIAYLEKAPLIYWLIAICLQDLRRPRLGRAHSGGAVGHRAGLAHRRFGDVGFRGAPDSTPGLCMATCVGLFLFTRILIPDVMLTASITLAMWAFLRAIDEEEPRPRLWAAVLAASSASAAAQEPDRRRVSGRRRARLSGSHAAVSPENLEAPASLADR